jgi:hypothetical protein
LDCAGPKITALGF